MKKHANLNADQHLHIRISLEDKEYIRKIVAQHGLDSISEFILLAIKSVPIQDKSFQREFIDNIKSLTRELNHIGNNINQAVTAIHIMNLRHEFNADELKRFNALMETYLQRREELKPLFKKVLKQ
ncbi:MAG TPA: hypothetical protein DCQ50_01610 [Chryseobacterium sp.]|nr:hypothetical protein [Chryseobacterium sp.]